jgi:teichuronic acid biosynthesis glycosyltransferase TuaC
MSLKLLTFTTLYPSASQPNHGVFVENRLRHLRERHDVESVVIAPVPWFPSSNSRFGRMADYARTPKEENRHGIQVFHPRYLVIPKIGMRIAPYSLASVGWAMVRRLIRNGMSFDMIDAHYLYPDAVAAARLGKLLNIPVVATARGSDITQIANLPGPRADIQQALQDIQHVITVSEALRKGVIALGKNPSEVTTLRNGVDIDVFKPLDKEECRIKLGIRGGYCLLSVGHLIERKRHHLAIEAIAGLDNATLYILGNGPERDSLLQLASKLGVVDRVKLVGSVPHAELSTWYSAADAIFLCSSREGWANVLLESMACGTPVIASDIPGNDEVVREDAAGIIVKTNDAAGFIDAANKLFLNPPSRLATRAYAEKHDWNETSDGQMKIMQHLLQGQNL